MINACANITGGGLKDNIKRVIPKGLCAEIDLNKIKTKKIFNWIRSKGVSDSEMHMTFNCGVGFCLIAKEDNFKLIKKYFNKKYQPYIIGKIIKAKNPVNLKNRISWT